MAEAEVDNLEEFSPPVKKGPGRPKGSKNKSTELKLAIESDMMDKLAEDAMAVVDKTVAMALEGDTTCIKLIWDRLMPARKAADGEVAKGVGGINIIINGMDSKETTVKGEVIDESRDAETL